MSKLDQLYKDLPHHSDVVGLAISAIPSSVALSLSDEQIYQLTDEICKTLMKSGKDVAIATHQHHRKINQRHGWGE